MSAATTSNGARTGSTHRLLAQMMTLVGRITMSMALSGCALLFAIRPSSGQTSDACDTAVTAWLKVDQGHPWRPPFGLERVGSPPVVHIELVGTTRHREYFVVIYRNQREVERRSVTFERNPENYSFAIAEKASSLFANLSLATLPEEVALYARCDERSDEIARQSLTFWPTFEADAIARPERRINPVDLGAVLVPHDWLLLADGQAAVIEVAAFSRGRDIRNATVRAGFTGDKPAEVAFPLTRDQRGLKELKIPPSVRGDRTTLHVSVIDGPHVLWGKDIPTMIVSTPQSWPAFGAVETQLRYDAPVVVTDSRTGSVLPSVDYSKAWDRKLNDVVVFLPNGSRFVFWRGSSYVPFWAGRFNTGINYQWVETAVPASARNNNAKDFILEPLFDKELRYGRVRIVESTASRVHVRWTYQLTDYQHNVWGDQAADDYYFYPDGFGTRVVTAPSTLGPFQQVSEFIILTPQAAYPLDVLPTRMLEVLSLDGGKGSVTFPVEKPIKAPEGERLPRIGFGAEMRRAEPTLFRIFSHKEDPASAIYFHPRDTSHVTFFPPFYERGELVTPVYWGNHWPLSRGGWTGVTINDRITNTPSHNSIGGPLDASLTGYEPKPETFESVSRGQLLDALGRPREMTTRRWAWLIAMTDLPDSALLDWATSFSSPPALEVLGARLDLPSYSAERRALRLVAEEPVIEIKMKPAARTVNPVFEIDQAPKRLGSIALDGKKLPKGAYAWDGAVLWLNATIGEAGAVIEMQFR